MLITATFKVISATTRVILATNNLVSATEKVMAEEVITDTLKYLYHHKKVILTTK